MIWLATRDVGLICFDPKHWFINGICTVRPILLALVPNHVYYLYENRHQNYGRDAGGMV